MPRRKNQPFALRLALWRGNGKRCFFCEDLVELADLEIDHLIPHTTPATELARLVRVHGLGAGFRVDDRRNLVPTHARCNRRKGAQRFSESSMRFYLETWRARQHHIRAEAERLKRQSENDGLLAAIAMRIESGLLSMDESVRFLSGIGKPGIGQEPTVVSFGLNQEDLSRRDQRELRTTEGAVRLYDTLLQRFRATIAAQLPSLHVQTDDDRNGETISVRIAFWNLDVERLDRLDIAPWEVLEVAGFTEVYPESGWDHLFANATIQTYHAVISNEDDKIFGLSRCPKCGNEALERASHPDPRDGDLYHMIRCQKCGWGDWTQ